MNVVTDCFTDLRTKKQTPSFTRLRLKTSSLCYSFKITKQKYETTSSSDFWVNKRIVLGMSSWPEEWWFAHLKSFSRKWFLKSDFCSKFIFLFLLQNGMLSRQSVLLLCRSSSGCSNYFTFSNFSGNFVDRFGRSTCPSIHLLCSAYQVTISL